MKSAPSVPIIKDEIFLLELPVITIIIIIIVVGVLLWLVNLIPMHPTVKSILNTVVIILLVVWLLNVFGLLEYLKQLQV